MKFGKQLSLDKNKKEERHNQIRFVSYCQQFQPNLLFWHTPNGEDRDERVAATLKAMGTEPGVPDIFIPVLMLFIEFKEPGEQLSPDQVATHKNLEVAGYQVRVYYDWKAAFAFVEEAIREHFPGGQLPPLERPAKRRGAG